MTNYSFDTSSAITANLGDSIGNNFSVDALKKTIEQLEQIGPIESFNGPMLYLEQDYSKQIKKIIESIFYSRKKAAELSVEERFVLAFCAGCSATQSKDNLGYRLIMQYPFTIIDNPNGEGFIVHEMRAEKLSVVPQTVEFKI